MTRYLYIFTLSFLIAVSIVIGYKYYFEVFESNSSKSLPISSKIILDLGKAPSSTIKAEVTSLGGDAIWISRLSKSPELLKKNQQIQQGESIETKSDSYANLTIGGLVFELDENSKISLIQALPKSIVIEQDSGVINYTSKNESSPLAIKVKHLLIRPADGEIKVKASVKSIEVEVIDGELVKIAYNNLDYTTETVSLSKGEVFMFDDIVREHNIL